MSDTTAEVHASHEPVSATEQFLEKNFTKLLLLAAVVVVGLLAYGFARYQNKQAAIAATEAFSSAKTVEDCDLVVSQHPGTSAAGNALLLKADLLWEENKKDSSTSVLREFLKDHEGHPLYPEALLGLASKLESMGEAGEAQPLFERLISEFKDSPVAPLAQIRLGDLLWSQGKEEQAKEVYEKLAVEFPNTNEPFYDQSQSRLEWITAQLPTKEVEPPPSAKKEEKKEDVLPGMKAPQIQIPGALGATISPDGGAMTPPISPAGQLPAPAVTATDAAGVTIPPAVAKEAAEAKKKLEEAAAREAAAAAKKVNPPAPKPAAAKKGATPKTDAPKAKSDAPKAKAPVPEKPKAEEAPAPAPAKANP